MRIRGVHCWLSLTGVASALALAAGCGMLPAGEENPSEGSTNPGERPGDPSGTGGSNFGPRPGEYPTGPNQNGTPVVRKLALDLSGVAGFAIVDQDGDTSSMTAGVESVSDGIRLVTSAASESAAAGSSSNAIWLNSTASGQVLRARAMTREPSALRETVLGRSDIRVGSGALGGLERGWVAQEDPGATPPGGTDGSQLPPPPDGSGAGGTGGTGGADSGDSAGEQAGLLKITQDGEVVPALVALEEEPIELPTETADAGAPPSEPDPGETGDPNAQPPVGAAGTGGATSGPSTGTGGAPPTAPTGPTGPMLEPLPRVTAVGLSPDGNVYILFERSFMYRAPTAEEMAEGGSDIYGPNSPFRCQLFRASGNWQDVTASTLAELECVTNQYEVRTWDARRVMQFDAAGNLYFRASVPGQPQEIFYQYDPLTRELHEKVNGNICWRDVQVTPRGSLFYTGISGSNGDCTGTSFFRYVSSDNRLTEIARDWWNFKYLAEQDPEDPENERIIFYGPDPNATGGFSWDSACLYRYNPAIETPAERTQKLVECSSNPWNYVYGTNGPVVADADLAAFGQRCTSEGQLFVGGEGVTGLSQLADGTLFVIGSFQKKLAGEVHCGFDVSVDHCDSLNPEHTTEELCTGAGATWRHAQPYCAGHPEPENQNPSACGTAGGVWENGFGYTHYEATGASCLTPMAGFNRVQTECRLPGQSQGAPPNFAQQVTGLAYLVPPSDGLGLSELRLLSEPTEEVERYWALEGGAGPELYYSVYSAGQYNLRMAHEVDDGQGNVEIERRLILEDHEVYNLQRDPAAPSRVLFDALQFSTNQYLFGSADTTLPTPEEIQASVETVEGVSGRVETLIVLPNF
jgi:hypothetical protein